MIISFIINVFCIIGWSFLFIQFVRGKYNPPKLTIGILFALAVFSFFSYAIDYYPFGGNP